MVGTLILFALCFQQVADVGKLPERNLQKDGGYQDEENVLFYVTKQFIHGWNADLDKVVEIEVIDGKIGAFTTINDRILISLYSTPGQFKTRIRDYDGKILGELPIYGSQFQKLNGELYLFRINLDAPHVSGLFPYHFQPIQIMETDNGFTYRTDGQPLFKFTSHLARFQFDFKDAWGFYKNGTFYFVNEIEPKVWIGSLTDVTREQKVGAAKPGNLPSVSLDLKGFNPIREPFNPGKGIYRTEEIQEIRWQWWASRSQIVGFQAYGDGYLVAYDYPQCDENGQCGEPLLALQIFDDQFQPIGEPTTVPGLLLGTIGTSAYILQFDKPLTAKQPQGPFHARILVLDSL